MHLACRTTGPTSSGALDRRGVETPNLNAQKMISFILESPMKCKWQKGIKRKLSYIWLPWLPWMSPCSFHRSKALVSHWNEIRESQFSSRKMKPKNLPGILPHSNSICSLPLGLQTLFPQISAKHLKESHPLVGWPLLSASSTNEDNVVDTVSQTQEQPFAPVTSSWCHPVASTLRNIFLAIPTWDNMGRSQTYGPTNMGMWIFPGKPMYFGDVKKIETSMYFSFTVPQFPGHLSILTQAPVQRRILSDSILLSELLQILWCSTFSQCSIYIVRIVNVESGWICFLFEKRAKWMLDRAFHETIFYSLPTPKCTWKNKSLTHGAWEVCHANRMLWEKWVPNFCRAHSVLSVAML